MGSDGPIMARGTSCLRERQLREATPELLVFSSSVWLQFDGVPWAMQLHPAAAYAAQASNVPWPKSC